VAAGDAKKLAVTEYWYKSGLDLAVIGEFTHVTTVTQDGDGLVDLGAAEAELAGLHCFSIDASDLDSANGFCCVRAVVPDTGGNAQLGAMLYILSGPRHAAAVMASAIID
jgi:hypothetical protein